MKIGIMEKNDPLVHEKANELSNWFESKHIRTIRKQSVLPLISESNGIDAPDDLNCVIVLGGDGTFLNAARWVGKKNIPLLGVKFGSLGFLADCSEESLFDEALAIINNEYSVEYRTRLEVTLSDDQKIIAQNHVLNDVVINKGALARITNIKTYIDNTYLTTFQADGLIVSTPTGSTAYSLAAGGPVVYPTVRGIILTPICPFTLTNRPIILPDSVSIRIQLTKNAKDIMITFDGQLGIEMNDSQWLNIKKSDYPIGIIKMPEKNYFDVLKTKLRWSGHSK